MSPSGASAGNAEPLHVFNKKLKFETSPEVGLLDGLRRYFSPPKLHGMASTGSQNWGRGLFDSQRQREGMGDPKTIGHPKNLART